MSAIQDWLNARHRGAVLLLVFAVLGLYLPYSGNPFFFDDLPFFSSAPTLESWGSALQRPRGLPYNTLQLTWQWFGNTLSHAYHFGDAVLHAANAVALFFLLHALLTCQSGDRPYKGLAWTCLVASLVFALNPVATYAAGYIIQRSILMATLFSLLAQLAWIKAWTENRAGLALLSVALYFLACFSKEHAVSLPAVMLAISLMLRDKRRLSRILIAVCVGAALLIAMYLMRSRADVVGAAYEPMSAHMFAQSNIQTSGWQLHLLSIATQAGLFFKYLLLWAIPAPAWMSIDMRVPFIASFGDWCFALGLLAYAAWGAFGLRFLFKKGRPALVGLAMLAPWLWFAVEFSTVRVQETFVLYRSYLWMPLLMLLPALLALRLVGAGQPAWQRILRWAVPVALIAILAPAAANRLAVAADPWTLWDDAARLLPNDDVPGADRILYNRGQAALAAGQAASAAADLQRVVRISPEIWQAWQLLGAAHLANSEPQLAIQDFTRALALRPGEGALLYGRAIALRRSDQPHLAMADLQAGCAAKWMPACLISARFQAEKAPIAPATGK